MGRAPPHHLPVEHRVCCVYTHAVRQTHRSLALQTYRTPTLPQPQVRVLIHRPRRREAYSCTLARAPASLFPSISSSSHFGVPSCSRVHRSPRAVPSTFQARDLVRWPSAIPLTPMLRLASTASRLPRCTSHVAPRLRVRVLVALLLQGRLEEDRQRLEVRGPAQADLRGRRGRKRWSKAV